VTLAVFALVLIPGAGITWALFEDDRLRPPTLLACIIGTGYSAVALWGTLLAILHIFSAVPFFIGIALITIGSWVLALRRKSARERWKLLRAQLTDERWSLVLGGLGVIAASAVMWQMSPLVNFGFANPWRYWADGLELATASHLPEETLQWGRAYAPAASKLIFSAFNGAVSFFGQEPLPAMEAMARLNVFGIAVGAWAVGRELGLRYTGPLFTVAAVAITTPILRHSLTYDPRRLFVAESFGKLFGACALALAINALRNRQLRTALVAGVIFGAAAGTHLVPVIVILGFFLAYAVVHISIERKFLSAIKVTGIVVGLCLATPFISLFLAGGAVGFEGARNSNEFDTDSGKFDPTLFLFVGAEEQPIDMQPAVRAEENNGWYDPPADVAKLFVSGATRIPFYEPDKMIMVVIALAVVAIGSLWLLPRPLKALPLAAFLLGAGMIVLSLFYSFSYETYVPARFPQRRFVAYDSLPLILLVLPVIEGLLLLLKRARAWLPEIGAAVLVTALAISALPSAAPTPYRGKRGLQAVETIDWIRANVPCDARMFVTQRTAGLFQSLTGRTSILEGMAPYLRPDMLSEVLDIVFDSRDFLRAPSDHPDFLTDHDVDFVMLVKRHGMFDGNPLIHRQDIKPELLKELDYLELIRKDRLVEVYQVDESLVPDDAPEPTEFSGYVCRKEPTPVG
jgi:hypothetical protein